MDKERARAAKILAIEKAIEQVLKDEEVEFAEAMSIISNLLDYIAKDTPYTKDHLILMLKIESAVLSK